VTDEKHDLSTLAEQLRVDQPRASRLAAAAVATGLARREADQTDGRRTRLVRTRRGIAATERVHASRRGIFATAMTDWSTEERATFARLLTRFVDALPSDSARS
jgi:DNA-binding MarR family transcriptional regulator